MVLFALQASNCLSGRPETKKLDLISCIKENNINKVQASLNQGEDPNGKDTDGYSPLDWACYCDTKGNIIQALLKAGARIDTKDKDGYSPLDWACGQSNVAAIKQLLQRAIELKAKDLRGYDGKTLLHYAADLEGNEGSKLVKQLLKLGADPNAKDHDGRTPWDDDQHNHIKIALCSIGG